MRSDETDGPDHDDWLAEEDPFDAPTRETSGTRRPPDPPGPGFAGRRVIALVAAASVILLVIIVITRGGDDEPPTDDPPPATAVADTSPAADLEAVPPAFSIQGTGTLQEGDRGRRVRQLQRALIALGYEVTRDGQFGPATTEAVRRFQADAGLEVDGVVGAGTIQALNEALAGERG